MPFHPQRTLHIGLPHDPSFITTKKKTLFGIAIEGRNFDLHLQWIEILSVTNYTSSSIKIELASITIRQLATPPVDPLL